jgi:hypothetical protein
MITSPDTNPKDVTSSKTPLKCWELKITGSGTSNWMSWVKEKGKWVQLRPSETSFISAVAAIEPEIMRLAFPHYTGRK